MSLAAQMQVYTGGKKTMRAVGVIGLLGMVASLSGIAFAGPKQAYSSYLFAYTYWVGISVASLLLLTIFHAVKARWMVVLRRAVETMSLTLPLFIVLFIPVALGMKHLFVWVAPPSTLSKEALHLLQHKQPYLNVPFFLARAGGYFALWTLVGHFLHRWSTQQDLTGDVKLTVKQRILGTSSIPFIALAMTFAAFDWLMSLDPLWFSTIFGTYYFAGAFVSAISILIIASTYGQTTNLFGRLVSLAQFHSLGKLLLAFTAFWAYIAFSQFMLIWVANLPEETPWFILRTQGGWFPVAIFLVVGHFLIPFFILLSQSLKLQPRRLAWVAIWILFAHAVDTYWMVMPVFSPGGPSLHPLDLAAFLGIGGLTIAFGIWRHQGHYSVPVRDPYLDDSLSYTQP